MGDDNEGSLLVLHKGGDVVDAVLDINRLGALRSSGILGGLEVNTGSGRLARTTSAAAAFRRFFFSALVSGRYLLRRRKSSVAVFCKFRKAP